MSLQRQFIRASIDYYVRSGCTEAEARRHASADAQWWRKELRKVLDKRVHSLQSR